MWKNNSQEYAETAWKNAKTKKDFMKKIGITNCDYRACKRAIIYFQLKDEDFGSDLLKLNKETTRKPIKEIIGKFFGELEVVSLNEEKSKQYQRTYYNCFCHKCGSACVKRTDYLKESIKDCGCEKRIIKKLNQIKDITGQFFGFLEVLELDKEETLKNKNLNNNVYWKCKCHKCGKITSTLGTALKYGNALTCGCSHDEMRKRKRIDMTGKTIGYIHFLEPDEEETLKRRELNKDTSLWWKCKCLNCGKEFSVKGSEVRQGHIISCGCAVRSRGELLIKEYLDKNKIKYEEQYSFPELKGKNQSLRFDFAIFKDNKIFTLIEFQGEQHYVAKDFFGGSERLKMQQEYDQRKRDYCKNNNIKLIEIPYWEINNIEEFLSKGF